MTSEWKSGILDTAEAERGRTCKDFLTTHETGYAQNEAGFFEIGAIEGVCEKMKRFLILFAGLFSIALFAKTNDVVYGTNDLSAPLKGVSGVLADDILTIKGQPNHKQNKWLYAAKNLGAYELGKNITVKAQIKAQIKAGEFWVVLRMVDAKNQTIGYQGFFIKKSQDWKKMKLSFTIPQRTKTMEFYCTGVQLDADSFGQVKNIQWEYMD